METNDESVLVDERQLVKQFVKTTQERNKAMAASFQAKVKEMGLRPFAGGIMTVPCSENMSIEDFFKNLLAVYGNNYAESIFFQCDNIRMRQIMECVNSYLSDRGLETDYLLHKQERENFKGRSKPRIVKQLTTRQGELN